MQATASGSARGTAAPATEKEGSKIGLPEVFGAFTLTHRLGRGGWATVYEAHRRGHERTPSGESAAQRVALKRLEHASPEGARRLTREAILLQSLSSPRIVKLLEHGYVEGVPYLALEYVDGIDLSTLILRLRLRKQPLPTELLLELLLQLGLALRVAHTRLDPVLQRPIPVVHGDVKPSNVLIGRDGRVRLTDFGSAQRLDQPEDVQEESPGTIGYISPERFLLQQHGTPNHALSLSSDLFGFGLIAFELCTLQPLFTGTSAQMLQQLVQADQFIPLALDRLPQTLHPKLALVVQRLLTARPEQRYAHVDDALRPLQELQQQLQLKTELASYVEPYLVPGPGERQELRITGGAPAQATLLKTQQTRRSSLRPGQKAVALQPVPIHALSPQQVTQLTREQLKKLVPTARRVPITLADVAEARSQRSRSWLGRVLLLLVVLTGGALALLLTLPHTLEIRSTPAGALISLQQGCEGDWQPAQLSPASVQVWGPWPVCVALEAPGYAREQVKILQPSSFARGSFLTMTLDKEVCLRVGSRPPGLPVFVDHRPRGITALDDLSVCGLRPFEPYVVQLQYDGVRWDIQEVSGKPGEIIPVFQDFAIQARVLTSPYERCVRAYDANELETALRICRVAVVEAPSLDQKLDALLIQGQTLSDWDDLEGACDLYGVALDRAVEARILLLERRVIDMREALDCETIEAARSLREEAEANGEELSEALKATIPVKSTRRESGPVVKVVPPGTLPPLSPGNSGAPNTPGTHPSVGAPATSAGGSPSAGGAGVTPTTPAPSPASNSPASNSPGANSPGDNSPGANSPGAPSPAPPAQTPSPGATPSGSKTRSGGP